MPRKTKQQRNAEKNARRTNNRALQHAQSKGLDTATNTCSAIRIAGVQDRHSKAIMTRSGANARTGGTLIGYNEDDMPWAGLNPGETYAFINCAEAKAYLEILARHADPKHYRITSFTPDKKVNPPCGNCRQWVYDTFGEVVDA
ncbi:hypothetical protein [Pseudomonas sp. PDM13]|uniref:hypothetical protein n=1 Tax=Pseudomonas sp. PDM13 TaxID=2769255 RepID=UPI0021E0B41F|nr:hypothetical protein [Pseudomonas sp. PDM13]MCU9947232.1 hypothetical protein [Pseudomonas sp. PDM13]